MPSGPEQAVVEVVGGLGTAPFPGERGLPRAKGGLSNAPAGTVCQTTPTEAPGGRAGWIHTRYRGGAGGRFEPGVGCWENVVSGAARALSTHASREQAVAVGRVLAAHAETTHVVHRRDGTVAYQDALNAEAYTPRWFD